VEDIVRSHQHHIDCINESCAHVSVSRDQISRVAWTVVNGLSFELGLLIFSKSQPADGSGEILLRRRQQARYLHCSLGRLGPTDQACNGTDRRITATALKLRSLMKIAPCLSSGCSSRTARPGCVALGERHTSTESDRSPAAFFRAIR
jgi:hypothetical protein